VQLFQNSVLKQHLASINQEPIVKAFEIYKKDFLPKIENIKNSKEEQYQYGFLDDLFVKVLGYTLNPTPNYNLTTEQKNLTDSKKADGAIIKDGKVIAVIELKSTKIKVMDKIVNQAFNYKNNHPTCKYIITSNFEKLRFYIEHSDKFEEFNLFGLNKERFTLLYTLLNQESIFADVALHLKEDSKLQEEKISNELYKKYSQLRVSLFENLVKNNPQIEKLELLENTQKLLDRMIFIFFAEDRGILPTNTIQAIVDRYKDDIESRELYHFYKIYFRAINEGNSRLKISEYNGGLFATDKALDERIIDDEVMRSAPLALSAYDFNSDVDVNILGHIFENSLNDIEEMKAKIDDESFDVKKSKRKKDGVFYTPEYITKYIVDNTLGKLCEAKKEELGLTDIEIKVPKNLRKLNKGETKQRNALDAYREYLLQLKILDPACGSGAFLNQALNFLLAEHEFIDESIKTLEGGGLGLYDVRKGILENNLYGVDINAEAVEIAKLSLWLRTVEKGRKLNSLAQKLKVGNSLIDDKSVVDNAFVWEEEFPEVFEQGGFDVVIGNPPYLGGRDWKNKETENYFLNKYEVAEYQFDMYILFWELGIRLTKKEGLSSYITPNTWLNNQKNTQLRNYILSKTSIISLVDYSQIEVFKDATVLTTIAILKKSTHNEETIIFKPIDGNLVKINSISQSIWFNNDYHIMNINLSAKDNILLKKIESQSIALKEFAQIKFGVKLYQKGKGKPKQESYFSKEKIFESNIKEDGTYRKYITGKDIDSYYYNWNNTWVKYGKNLAEPRYPELFEGSKILVRRIVGQRLISSLIEEDLVTSQLLQIVKLNDDKLNKTIIAILNSSLMIYFFKKKYNRQEKTFPEIRIYELGSLPILKEITPNEEIDKSVYSIIELNKNLQQSKQAFLDMLELEKIPKKLQNFEELSFDGFIKEYKKAKKLKFPDKLAERNFKNEWKSLFENDKEVVTNLQTQIDATDREIDLMVYELYGLSDDEVALVEGEI
jgi:type I restriction-modification system DNA methylase subunit